MFRRSPERALAPARGEDVAFESESLVTERLIAGVRHGYVTPRHTMRYGYVTPCHTMRYGYVTPVVTDVSHLELRMCHSLGADVGWL